MPLSPVIVCGTLSKFVHVTVVPAATVMLAGENVKFAILTETAAGCAGGDVLFPWVCVVDVKAEGGV